MANVSTAAIMFALEDDDPVEFLRYWLYGDFDVLRREWPDAPKEVYIGADPLLPETKALMEAQSLVGQLRELQKNTKSSYEWNAVRVAIKIAERT